ncbi:MAG TPA: hypothetical protein VF921_01265 [Vicinamibacterales bacterium]
MRRLISRTATLALSVTVALGAAAVPCAAGETAAARTDGTLTRLSPASRQVLVSPKPRRGDGGTMRRSQGGQPAGAPSSPGSFFKSTRGKVTLALMGAGTGLTLWSIQHDRKPVKSPIR